MNPESTGLKVISIVGRLQAELARLRQEIQNKDETLAATRDREIMLESQLTVALKLVAAEDTPERPDLPPQLREAMRPGRWARTVRLDAGGRNVVALVSGAAGTDEDAEADAALSIYRFLTGEAEASAPTMVCGHEFQTMPPRLLGVTDVASNCRIIISNDLGRRGAREARTLLRRSWRTHHHGGRWLAALLPLPFGFGLAGLRFAEKGVRGIALAGVGVTATITLTTGAVFNPPSPFSPVGGHGASGGEERTDIADSAPLGPHPERPAPSIPAPASTGVRPHVRHVPAAPALPQAEIGRAHV